MGLMGLCFFMKTSTEISLPCHSASVVFFFADRFPIVHCKVYQGEPWYAWEPGQGMIGMRKNSGASENSGNENPYGAILNGHSEWTFFPVKGPRNLEQTLF